MRIDGVIFDYGNVISLPQSPTDIAEMVLMTGSDAAQFAQSYWQFREEYDRGSLSGVAYWFEVARQLGTTFDQELIRRLIEIDSRSWFLPNPKVLQWLAAIRRQGRRLSLLSNMPQDLLNYRRASVDWLPRFDDEAYSCELHSIKPEAAIYQHCLTRMGCLPSRTLFIDDRQINIDGAARLGMNTLLFTSFDQAVSMAAAQFGITRN